jgi:hypothetical protein
MTGSCRRQAHLEIQKKVSVPQALPEELSPLPTSTRVDMTGLRFDSASFTGRDLNLDPGVVVEPVRHILTAKDFSSP